MAADDALDVVVVGGGSFGTALAHLLASLGRRVLLWVRRADLAEEINERHANSRYLEGFGLSPALRATTELASSVRRAQVVILAVPSLGVRAVARAVGETLAGDQILVHAVKGIELGTCKRVSEILREETCALELGVLSGPTLAVELMQGRAAGGLIASRFDEVVTAVQRLFSGGWLRVYGGGDMVGTEIGGAFKNIVAIAAGVADGLDMGANTRALLVTRGLGEMARLGVALGADVLTFGGLAGAGDLVATCGSPLSHNHEVGVRLARGERLEEILSSMAHVAEGVPTTRAVHELSGRMGLTLPIVAAVHSVLFGGTALEEAIQRLMAPPAKRELAALWGR